MVIDSSAFLALLFDEPERDAFRRAIDDDPVRLASAATLLESSMIALARLGEPGLAELRVVFAAVGAETVSFGREEVEGAVDAFRRLGKGRHRAALNFGDWFSYALAKATGEALLFKGNGFGLTDIARVV
jgi:ribonuclease VapC